MTAITLLVVWNAVVCMASGALFATLASRYRRHRGCDMDSLDFKRGVEFGLIFSKLRRGELPSEGTVHPDILDSVIRAAQTKGVATRVGDRYRCQPGDCPAGKHHTAGEEWVEVTFTAEEAS